MTKKRGVPRKPRVGEKNQHAVALGHLGGQKGGSARARTLTPKQRAASAKKAVDARWAKEKKAHPKESRDH